MIKGRSTKTALDDDDDEDDNDDEDINKILYNSEDGQDGLDLIQDGESTLINVVESSRSSQQWVTIIEENLLGAVYRTETTEILDLVE